MAKTKARDRFEDLAFRCEISARPGDRAAQLAYTDWLMEHAGLTVMGAKRVVTKLVREAIEERLQSAVVAWLYGGSEHAKRMLRGIYNTTEVGDEFDLPIRVERTSYPPMVVYDSITSELKLVPNEGNRDIRENWLDNPNGSPIPSRIEVGFRWIMRWSERWQLGCPTTV